MNEENNINPTRLRMIRQSKDHFTTTIYALVVVMIVVEFLAMFCLDIF